jgi:hypothetical protein
MLRPILLLMAFCLAFISSACSRPASVLTADANGYFCTKCENKFYTSSSSAVEKCPKCQAPNIEEVVAYVCPVDTEVIIVSRNMKGAICSKCGKFTNEMKLPSKEDLKNWGAYVVTGVKM